MPASGKVSLLIVEDDARIRFLLETAAQRSGLFGPVTSAADGQDGLDQLQRSEQSMLPGMIVTDLSMPRMNGLEFLRAIKRDARMRHIPVGIITSSDLPDDRALALAAGACSFVQKPLGVEALVAALASIHDSCREAAGARTSGGRTQSLDDLTDVVA
jgi:CheY-like chemotaxis protein